MGDGEHAHLGEGRLVMVREGATTTGQPDGVAAFTPEQVAAARGFADASRAASTPLRESHRNQGGSLGYSRLVVGAVDTRERLLDQIDGIKRGALDPYATFRSLYRQNRADQTAKSRTDRPATVPAWLPQP